MRIFFTVFFCSFLCSFGWTQSYSDSISVNFFLLDECRISQNITGEINRVYDTYKSEGFIFKAYFPSPTTSLTEMDSFMHQYQLKMDAITDYKHKKLAFYGATIAPQVVVYDEINKEILYTGRIDNSYDKVGSRRRVITSFDLRKALEAISLHVEIETKETQAIGCILNGMK